MSKNKYYNQLVKNGYCIINRAFKKQYCEKLIKKTENLYKKKKKQTIRYRRRFFVWSGNY